MIKHYPMLFLILCLTFLLISCQEQESVVQYTITFETHGGTPIEPITAIEGSVIPDSITTEREGFLFHGWYLDDEHKEVWSLFSDQVSSDMILYARWLLPFKQQETETYILNFTTDGLNSDAFTFEGGQLVDLDAPITVNNMVFTKAYVFTYQSKIKITPKTDYARIHMIAFTTDSEWRKVWIKNPIEGTEMNFWHDPGLKVSMLRESSEHSIMNGDGYGQIHILWIKVVENSIPPVLQEGEHLITLWSYTNDVYTYMVVKDGEKIPELGGPVNEGYTFAGWYTHADFQHQWDFNTHVTEDVYLVAKWEKNPDIIN